MNSASRSSPVPSWLTSVLLGVLMGNVAAPAIAATFEQVDVDQSKFIAIAAPVGNSQTYQLLILEQVADSRPCWQTEGSQPVIVDPLLLQFDFTGICSRSTDSNGYSVRLAGEDYGLQYSLRVQRQDTDLLLLAIPFRGKEAPTLVVGRAHGLASGFLRLDLEPGWRFAKRSFNGQRLGHIYLTHDRPLQEFAQQAAPLTPTSPPASPPQTPTPLATIPVMTTKPGNAAVALGSPAMAFNETDQPIIIPVPPPETGPIAAANTGMGGPLSPNRLIPANVPPSTPVTTVPTAPAPPDTANATLIATANLPTVRIAPTPSPVPPRLADPAPASPPRPSISA
ncbi:DUF3747 domain-containing protein, partial [Trichothermofontia sp.]